MVDYDFYISTYRGSSISNANWPTFCSRAEEQLARYKRIYTVTPPEETSEETSEAMAVCAMAEVMAAISAAQSGAGAVTSASIGSVSVSYGNSTAIDLSPKGQARELYGAACRYLDIYRG